MAVKNYTVTVNGTPYNVQVAEGDNAGVQTPAPVAAPAPKPAAKPAPAPSVGSGIKITAPMPGLIVKTNVNIGDSVKKGQTVVVLEAMKMENDVVASDDGVVASVNVKKGDNVESGQTLVTIN